MPDLTLLVVALLGGIAVTVSKGRAPVRPGDHRLPGARGPHRPRRAGRTDQRHEHRRAAAADRGGAGGDHLPDRRSAAHRGPARRAPSARAAEHHPDDRHLGAGLRRPAARRRRHTGLVPAGDHRGRDGRPDGDRHRQGAAGGRRPDRHGAGQRGADQRGRRGDVRPRLPLRARPVRGRVVAGSDRWRVRPDRGRLDPDRTAGRAAAQDLRDRDRVLRRAAAVPAHRADGHDRRSDRHRGIGRGDQPGGRPVRGQRRRPGSPTGSSPPYGRSRPRST